MFLVCKRNVSLRRFFNAPKIKFDRENPDDIYFGGYIFFVYLPIIRTTNAGVLDCSLELVNAKEQPHILFLIYHFIVQ